MKVKNSKLEFYLPLSTIFADSACIVFSYYLTYQLRFYSFFADIIPVTAGYPDIRGYLYFGIVTIPIWLITFQAFKMYRIKRNVSIFDEFFAIVKCVTISLLLSIGVLFFFREFPYSRIVFLMLWFTISFFMTLCRYLLLKLEKTLYNNDIGVKNVAVIGNNELAMKIYEKYTIDKYVGFKVVGYITKNKPDESEVGNRVYLGTYDSILDIIKEHDIEKILVSLSTNEQEDLYTVMSLCEGINVEFLSVPDFVGIITSKLRITEIDGIPFIKLKSIPMNIWNRIVKRLFDIIFSFILLLIASPLLIILSILIKIDSKGSVFYKQERIGLDGKSFLLIKFRSMRTNAESSGPRFVSDKDERITRIGKYLRRFSLDELPQFFNVLKGEMSVVGPRPEREYFILKLKDSIKRYLERHRVKCGITGWAQVNGYRGPTTSLQSRIDYDIYYIENWSLDFDFKIILKTLKEVFFSKNAA